MDLPITREDLTSPVLHALDSESAEVTASEVASVGYAGSTVGHNLFRVSGQARDHGQIRPWTLLLKVILPPPGETYPPSQVGPGRPPHWGYWAAEPLAYASGLLDDLPGITAPRCYGVTTSREGKVWLWLEEIREDGEHVWPLERYGLAARHFGRFNGAYLTGRPLPTDWWIGQERGGPRAFLPGWIWHEAAALISRDATWDHRLVRRAYPASTADRLRRIWADNDAFYAAAHRLPRTFCHFDAFRPNLFARRDPSGEEQTVAIDWSFLGIGAVGEELAAMVAATLGYFEVEGDKARELGEMVFEGYLAGLRDAGWTGDAQIARLGYALAASRYAVLYSGVQLMADEATWERWRPIWRRPLDDFVRQWPPATLYLLDLADEARQLLDAGLGD